MSQPYVGEIRMFGGNFGPAGWMLCQGQTLAISEYETLFQLIGTTYGGDGQSTFNIPNLCGRVPVHQGTSPFGTTFTMAESAGTETVTLSALQIPIHTHTMLASNDVATSNAPANQVFAASTGATVFPYGSLNPINPISNQEITMVGGSQPHENMQPYLCIQFIISLFGIFPSPT
jgi:microcystin-dependent protein